MELDLGLEPAGGGPLPITSSKMGHLLDALERGYRVLGFEASRAWPGGGPLARGPGWSYRGGHLGAWIGSHFRCLGG